MDIEARFWAKVEKTPEGCWLWTGFVQENGYGQFEHDLVHRWAYARFVGPIPEGHQIDHVEANGCRHRHCVNFEDHLEPVTQAENIRRGRTGKVNNHQTRKTACPQGHAYDETNTLVYNGRRNCRTCRNERARARRSA